MQQNNPAGLAHVKRLIKENLETQATFLNLANCGLRDLGELPELWDCQHLEGLSLGQFFMENEEYNDLNYSYGDNKIGVDGAKLIGQNLKSLTSLNLGFNDIGVEGTKHIVQNLLALTSLNLGFNDIGVEGTKHIVQNLLALTSLNLGLNNIGVEGAKLIGQNLKSLTSLNLDNCDTGFEGAIHIAQHLESLTSLKLSNYHFGDLDGTFPYWKVHIGDEGAKIIAQNLKSLTSLDLLNNNIGEEGGTYIAQNLKSLTSLNLGFNNIRDEGAKVIAQNLKSLTSLNLEFNQIGVKGAKVIAQNLKSLTSLNLRNNQIGVEGAKVIAQNLHALTSLNLSDNQIGDGGAKHIAQNLNALTSLNLSYNQIGDGGAKHIAQNLNALTSLNLSYNQIGYEGAKAIAQNLKSLSSLNLYINKIGDGGAKTIVQHLKSLNSLNVSNNRITYLTYLLPLLKNKNCNIYFDSNPITTPPEEIWKQGMDAIIHYFERIKKEKVLKLEPYTNKEVKLIFTGNSNAGKSTLVKYLTENVLDKKLPSTHWMEIKDWKNPFGADGKIEHVRIFDFGGQEYYHDTHYLFFTNNTAYVLLWDLEGNAMKKIIVQQKKIDGTVREVSLQCFPLEYWMDAVCHFTKVKQEAIPPEGKEWNYEYRMLPGETEEKSLNRIDETNKWLETSKPSILLVQNKLDEGSPKKLPLDQYEKEYKSIDIFDSLAISLHENRFLTSMSTSLEEMLNSMDIINKTFEGTYRIIKDNIESYDGSPVVTMDDFLLMCNKWIGEQGAKVNEDYSSLYFALKDAKICANVFTMLGYIMYFPASDKLSDKVFIHQNKITNTIYKILEPAEHSLGIIRKEIKQNEVDDIFELMQHFKILFKHPDIINKPNVYIAPLYLPIEPSKEVNIFISPFLKPTFRIVYKYFIHKSIILDFFQSYGQYVVKEQNIHYEEIFYYWRNGIVVKKIIDNLEELVLVRFFNGQDETTIEGVRITKRAHIDLYVIKSKGKSQLIEEIRDKLQEINKGWSVTKKVTLDGHTFIDLEEILEREQKNQYIWYDDQSKKYELHQFKQYLTKPLQMKKVFISYSKSDEHYRSELEKHLSVLKRNGHIDTWHDRKLLPGEKWDGKIKEELKEADIIIFLVSADFLATDYIWDVEIQCALDRDNDPNDSVSVVPIILKKCDWADSPLGIYNSPGKGKDISTAPDKDEAIYSIVKELKKIMKS